MDTCITLRTMVVKAKTVHFQAGGGIVAELRPDAEYPGDVDEGRAMLDAARMAEAGCNDGASPARSLRTTPPGRPRDRRRRRAEGGRG